MKTTPLYDIHRQLGATFAERHEGWNLVTHFTDAVSEHHAVRNNVGIADLSHRGRLLLTGDDRAQFLHRLISNEVETLAVGEGNYATLLTHRGKIIADLNVYVLQNVIGISTAPETSESLFTELDKYIIADDVELTLLTDETGTIAVYGPKSTELVETALNLTDICTLPEYHNRFGIVDDHWIVCVRLNITGETGYHLYTAAESLAWLWDRLITTGADAQPIGWDALQSLRIEAGTPRYGTELTDTVIPLEAELEYAINFEKGCYIGQEIVARMKYRGHPNRLLRGIEMQTEQLPQQNATVFSGDKKVGWITSATYSPTLQKPIALGYVRMAVTAAGSPVQIETPTGRIDGTVVTLPFFANTS